MRAARISASCATAHSHFVVVEWLRRIGPVAQLAHARDPAVLCSTSLRPLPTAGRLLWATQRWLPYPQTRSLPDEHRIRSCRWNQRRKSDTQNDRWAERLIPVHVGLSDDTAMNQSFVCFDICSAMDVLWLKWFNGKVRFVPVVKMRNWPATGPGQLTTEFGLIESKRGSAVMMMTELRAPRGHHNIALHGADCRRCNSAAWLANEGFTKRCND